MPTCTSIKIENGKFYWDFSELEGRPMGARVLDVKNGFAFCTDEQEAAFIASQTNFTHKGNLLDVRPWGMTQ